MPDMQNALQPVESSQRIGLINSAQTRIDLESAILSTIAYADIFDYPLTFEELHRYLIGRMVPPDQLHAVMSGGDFARNHISRVHGFYTLPGRENIVRIRKQRAKFSAHQWSRANSYGQLIAGLPYVRMVAVTGALAMDNARPGDDIDYLIVTAPGRLWLCRAIIIGLVRWADKRGERICPNYFLSERGLVFMQHSLYTAHELVQMIPLAGQRVYKRIRQLNTWALGFLPNAEGQPPGLYASWVAQKHQQLSKLAESALNSALGSWFEQWEMNRKVQKFQGQIWDGAEVSFCADWCKGHFDGHGEETMKAYAARLEEFGIPDIFDLDLE